MPDQEDLATRLARVARAINAPTDLSSTLRAIVQSAMDSLPGIDHVGISMVHKDGTIETMAGTDQLVWDLDAVQYDLQEGPATTRSCTRPSWWPTSCATTNAGHVTSPGPPVEG